MVSPADKSRIKVILALQTTKADKIRRLLDLGLPRATVAKLLDIRYQFVYQVDQQRIRSRFDPS